VECLWPDAHEGDLQAVDERATAAAERLTARNRAMRYLGSMLMREDEVVLCLFEGELEDVREVAESAQVPFERILETTHSPWTPQKAE
jgi:hypothetical protein